MVKKTTVAPSLFALFWFFFLNLHELDLLWWRHCSSVYNRVRYKYKGFCTNNKPEREFQGLENILVWSRSSDELCSRIDVITDWRKTVYKPVRVFIGLISGFLGWKRLRFTEFTNGLFSEGWAGTALEHLWPKADWQNRKCCPHTTFPAI